MAEFTGMINHNQIVLPTPSGADETLLDAHAQPPLSSLVLVGFLTERERDARERRLRGEDLRVPKREPDMLAALYCGQSLGLG